MAFRWIYRCQACKAEREPSLVRSERGAKLKMATEKPPGYAFEVTEPCDCGCNVLLVKQKRKPSRVGVAR